MLSTQYDWDEKKIRKKMREEFTLHVQHLEETLQ